MAASELTKQAIVCSFKQLVAETDFEHATVDRITALIGVNRQTFYYHFADKYDLVNYIFFGELFVPFADSLDNGNVTDAFNKLFANIDGQRKFFRKLFDCEAKDNFAKYFNAVAASILTTLADGKIKETDLEADFFANGLTGVVTAWCLDDRDISPCLLAERACRFADMFVEKCC